MLQGVFNTTKLIESEEFIMSKKSWSRFVRVLIALAIRGAIILHACLGCYIILWGLYLMEVPTIPLIWGFVTILAGIGVLICDAYAHYKIYEEG